MEEISRKTRVINLKLWVIKLWFSPSTEKLPHSFVSFKMPLAIWLTLSHWLRGLLSCTVQLKMVQVQVLVTLWGKSCWSHDMLVIHCGLSQWLALTTVTVTGSHQQKQLSYQLCLSTAPRARPLILQSRASIAFCSQELRLRYSTSLHYAIDHLHWVDGTLPAHSKGRKVLDLLDADSLSQCFCMWHQ